jgi:hypothetical protein
METSFKKLLQIWCNKTKIWGMKIQNVLIWNKTNVPDADSTNNYDNGLINFNGKMLV